MFDGSLFVLLTVGLSVFISNWCKVSVLDSSEVVRGFEPRSGQAKDYRIDSCCFPAKYAASMRKIKDWLAWILG